ncbi:hypothetical protein MVES_000588 [Malassezia vespertilionis]|uniref:Partial AB-hydrolase lipase domain-containing protein n=1 Tax=Malassezia vespertilionis TaxID=2020962 RepID=A0A2N1JG30_9BASI|nr:hypothetical protein MVES_000588 [Malassezia vespertilionis]
MGTRASLRPLQNGCEEMADTESTIRNTLLNASRDSISRPNSSLSMRVVRVDSVESEELEMTSIYRHVPNTFNDSETMPLINDMPDPARQCTESRREYAFISLSFLINQTTAVLISSVILVATVAMGLCSRFIHAIPDMLLSKQRPKPLWDNPERWRSEELVKNTQYYAENCGFFIVDEQAETQDGYYLCMHRVECKTDTAKNGPGKGFPVLIMHGLFQSSGSFVTSEERSLAFWLAAKGYQVYMGNNRAAFDMGHRTHSRYSPAFWDYNIHDLALYDLPAMVDFVRHKTEHDKIAYIGHSQGNAIMFLALSRWFVPALADRISYFAALAPAVYSGPLTKKFPLKYLSKLDWLAWRRLFGVCDFIPLMKFSYDWTPATPYAALGYQMFAYLFEWTDTNWLLRRKGKMFRFTPQPTSSASMFWWAGKNGFAERGCLFAQDTQWYDERFPPAALFGGGADRLVLTEPLLEHFDKYEHQANLIRIKIQPGAEHCDHYWSADAVEWCFNDILE